MNTAVTVLQVVLTFFFGAGGLLKLTQPYAKFARMPFQAWSNDFSAGSVRLVGLFELATALGLIAALLVPSLSKLAPFAAVGGALVMAGAMSTHLRRAEYPNMLGNLVWLGLALFVAYGTLVGFAA